MGKLKKAFLMAAVVLISLGVSVVRSNPTELETIVPGLLLIAVGGAMGIVYLEYFEKRILEKISPKKNEER